MINNLNEAIKHCEEKAEREQQIGFYANIKANQPTEYGTKCYECAKEHRQLAEWLKELKAYREVRKDVYMDGYNEGYEDAKELFS